MEEMLQDVWSSFLHVAEGVIERLQGKTSMMEFQKQLRADLDGLGRQIITQVAEAADRRLVEQPTERSGWVVGRRDDKKELLTTFGPVTYHRTYFRHKNTRQYRYLVDEMLGVSAHQRIDTALKAQLAAQATHTSYRKSGSWSQQAGWHVSGQSVMHAVRAAHTDGKVVAPKKKRNVQYLFIEADEDHVASQEGTAWQPRLVYVHEGIIEKSKRRELRNPRYFGGLYIKDSESLWNQVWHYLDETYELEDVAAILVSGDGASWIKHACEYIPGSVFLLDRYHAHKYVVAATGQNMSLQGRLWHALNAGERSQLKKVLDEAESHAETAARQRAVEEARCYFASNWGGIQAWKAFKGVWPGCSAEGHVSHIYSDRLSSRPMAWAQTGVDQMARLRVLQANGESVEAAYLESRPAPVLRVGEISLNNVHQQVKRSSSLAGMVINNMPALKGHRSYLRIALHHLANAS